MASVRHPRRGVGRGLILATAGLLAMAGLVASGATAGAATHHRGSAATKSCRAGRAPPRTAHAGVFVRPPAPRASGCIVPPDGPATGLPPLLYHGGPVMPGSSSGRIVVTPIYW